MKLPFLKNFRRGFATNSSSSHSFVYLRNDAEDAHAQTHLDGEDFGWGDFKLSSIREKLFYVLASMVGNRGWGSKTSEDEVEEAYRDYGDKFPEFTREDFVQAVNSSVDHESRGTITADMARDPKVVVFGGNDNSDGSSHRARAITNGQVDWTRTSFEYGDEDHLP